MPVTLRDRRQFLYARVHRGHTHRAQQTNDGRIGNWLTGGIAQINVGGATDTEVKEAGLVAGAASAVGLKGIKIVADESITSGTNFVAGANKPDTHFRNVN